MLARVLARLAAAIRAYGSLIRANTGDAGAVCGIDGNELDRHLEDVREHRDLFALLLSHAPEPASAGWRLRGEMLVHLDRLTSELQVERLSRTRNEEGAPFLFQEVRAIRSRRPAMCPVDAGDPAV